MPRADVAGEPPLELLGPRAGRQPARADRLGHGGDLLFPDGGRLEAEEGLATGSDALHHRLAEGYATSPRDPARARAGPTGYSRQRLDGRGPEADRLGRPPGALDRLVARRTDGQDRARPVGAAAQRADHGAGIGVDPHPDDPVLLLRLLDARDRVEQSRRLGDEEADARAARARPPPAAVPRPRARRAPHASASPFRSTPSAAAQSSASWPPPSRAASSTT